ncbi:MAG TPA: RidA family protein [Vicinamibacterales bacterium]|nr:RidA family protein [Vicinamibacterales bacterium]
MCSLLAGVVLLGGLAAAQTRQTFPGPMPNLPFSAAVKADGLIYVAGTLSAEGDVRAQTRTTIEDISAVLQKAGSSLANVASVNVYLTRAEDFAAMNEVYRTFWPKEPPVRTTIVSDLVVAGALVEISMIAVPNGGERVVIHPSDWIKSPNPYSYGIRSGDTLFLAGLVARNGKDNSVVEGDMTTQTKAVLDNAGQILKAAGLSFDNVVSSRVFITDGARFQEMNKAYTPYFPKDPPARATVVAPLMGPQYQVEITLTASRLPKRVITTPMADGSPGKPSAILSSAVEVGNRLYLSGMLGNTKTNVGDAEAQTVEIMNRVGRTLEAAGYDRAQVVDGVVYITDVKHFDAMNRGYRTIFTKDFPARATVRTGLVNATGLVEIMFVATK